MLGLPHAPQAISDHPLPPAPPDRDQSFRLLVVRGDHGFNSGTSHVRDSIVAVAVAARAVAEPGQRGPEVRISGRTGREELWHLPGLSRTRVGPPQLPGPGFGQWGAQGSPVDSDRGSSPGLSVCNDSRGTASGPASELGGYS